MKGIEEQEGSDSFTKNNQTTVDPGDAGMEVHAAAAAVTYSRTRLVVALITAAGWREHKSQLVDEDTVFARAVDE